MTFHNETLPEFERPEPLPEAEAQARLAALAAKAKEEMVILGHNHDWVPEPEEGAYNVIIIGGGQAGLGSAFALSRHRIGKVKVLQEGPADYIGCWGQYARMHTLRSPKNMKGIELDIPSLHTENWFKAKYGEQAWEVTNLVPRLDWEEYLKWYREVTEADVDFNTHVHEVLPADEQGYFTIRAVTGNNVVGDNATGEPVEYRARRVIFSLGLNGGGGPFVPPVVRNLPDDMWAHTEDLIDFNQLVGKRVVIIGGGASGFDNAGTALERGAATVTMHVREPEIARHNSLRWMEFPGMQEHFFDLSDAERFEFSVFNGGLPQPPTQASVWRAHAYDNFDRHVNIEWTSAEVVERDGEREIHIVDNHGQEWVADYVISATGYFTDLGARPELKHFVGDIKKWAEAYGPAAEHPLGQCPYLGDGFQFEASAGASEAAKGYLPKLFHLSTGARVSHGVAGNQLSGIYACLTRLSNRIAADITKENWADFYKEFQAFEFEEITNTGRHTEGDVWYPQGPRY